MAGVFLFGVVVGLAVMLGLVLMVSSGPRAGARAAPSPAARVAAMEEVAAQALADIGAAASSGPRRPIAEEVMAPWRA